MPPSSEGKVREVGSDGKHPSQECIDLKEFVLTILSERSKQYDVRFAVIDKELTDAAQAIKDALSLANSNVAAMGNAIETRVGLAMTANKEAVLKAEIANERRFESVNEFRAQMADQQNTLARKAEMDIRFDAMEKKMDLLMSGANRATGKESGANVVWGVVAVVCALAISAVGVVAAVLFRPH